MLRGKAFEKQPEAFLQGLKNGLIEGLVKTVSAMSLAISTLTTADEPAYHRCSTVVRSRARASRDPGAIL